MFGKDHDVSGVHGGAGSAAPGPLRSGTVRAWTGTLTGRVESLREPSTDAGAGLVEQIRALEELKNAAAARQARLSVALDRQRRAEHAGLPTRQRGRGVAGEVALARRESPHRGQRHLGLATILDAEMPHTMAAFTAGRITEWRATLLARGTACLSLEHRAQVDRAVAGDAKVLESMSDSGTVAEVHKLAYRLDPHAVAKRRARAEADRRVTLRPAPDTMTYLTGLLPVAQGVSVFAALQRHADAMTAVGDPRGRGQIMADTLVERVTGSSSATSSSDSGPTDSPGPATGPSDVSVAVNLVMTDRTLLSGDQEPAHLDGYGPIPADLARELIRRSVTTQAKTWLRRLYTAPRTRDLIAMDSHQRLFPTALSRLIRFRDQTCRTPWCDAPIRHTDHADPAGDGGPTSVLNGQGLCEACNHHKQAPGWHARARPGPRHTIATTTPSGHTYLSTAPAAAGGHTPPPSHLSPAEDRHRALLLTA